MPPNDLYTNFHNNLKDLEENCPGFGYYTLLNKDRGYCYGLAHMYGRAVLANDVSSYDKRLSILTRDYDGNPIYFSGKYHNKLSSFLNEVIFPFERKREYNSIIPIGISEDSYRSYISIRAFLDGLLLYQKPSKIGDKGYLLKEHQHNLLYPLEYTQSALHASEYVGYNAGMKEVFNRPFVLTEYNADVILEKLFGEIDEKLQNIKYYITFGSCSHCVCLIYEFGRYFLYDANMMRKGFYKKQFSEISDIACELRTDPCLNEQNIYSAPVVNIAVHIENRDNLCNNSQFVPDTMLLDMNYSYFLQQIIVLKIYETTEFLYVACKNGHVDIVKLLLRQPGIGVNMPINDGVTPLYIACYKGHVEIVKLLLSQPCTNVNQPTNDGTAPLHIACDKGHVEIVKLLFRRTGINVNRRRNDGATPLHIACDTGNDRIVYEFLMDGRADCSLKYRGQTAFGWYKGKDQHLENVLRVRGDKGSPQKSNYSSPQFGYVHNNYGGKCTCFLRHWLDYEQLIDKKNIHLHSKNCFLVKNKKQESASYPVEFFT